MTTVSKLVWRDPDDFGDLLVQMEFDVTGEIDDEGNTEFFAELATLQIGSLKLSRYQAVEAFNDAQRDGETAIRIYEEAEADRSAEDFRLGCWRDDDEAYDIMAAE